MIVIKLILTENCAGMRTDVIHNKCVIILIGKIRLQN